MKMANEGRNHALVRSEESRPLERAIELACPFCESSAVVGYRNGVGAVEHGLNYCTVFDRSTALEWLEAVNRRHREMGWGILHAPRHGWTPVFETRGEGDVEGDGGGEALGG